MTALDDLLKGDSALQLCFSEFRTRSRNSTIVPTFMNFSFFVCILLCTVQVENIFEDCGNDSQEKK